jgi:hypothetical protein
MPFAGRSLKASHVGRSLRRQLSITDFAHKAAVKGDSQVRAAFAAGNMAAQRRGAAALDRTHHLQLAEADMAAIGLAPCGAVIAEDISDLQRWPDHDDLSGRRRLAFLPWLPRDAQMAQRACDGRDPARRNARIARRRVKFDMAEKGLD